MDVHISNLLRSFPYVRLVIPTVEVDITKHKVVVLISANIIYLLGCSSTSSFLSSFVGLMWFLGYSSVASGLPLINLSTFIAWRVLCWARCSSEWMWFCTFSTVVLVLYLNSSLLILLVVCPLINGMDGLRGNKACYTQVTTNGDVSQTDFQYLGGGYFLV